ncbi:MAG TPA: hypothetical protein VGP72_04090 [Planctomycetota bacterium]
MLMVTATPALAPVSVPPSAAFLVMLLATLEGGTARLRLWSLRLLRAQ